MEPYPQEEPLNLELLEHAHVADVLCEYGTIDEVGK